MLVNKKFKFAKIFKRTSNNKKKSFKLSSHIFYGFVALDFGILTSNKIELLRRFIIQKLNKNCKIYFKTSLTRTLTKKAEKSRMGKGRGDIDVWYTYIKPGSLLLEIEAFNKPISISSAEIKSISSKLSFKCKLYKLSYTFRFGELTGYPIYLKKKYSYEKAS